MTPKNRTLEGKNRTLGGDGGSKIVGHHLWMFPNLSLVHYCVILKGQKETRSEQIKEV